MLRRTKGRILLTMLVITGLAGTINNSTLSNHERKFAVSLLKDSRTDMLASVKNLSDKQLNFRPSPNKWSIRECLYHMAQAEELGIARLESGMKESARPEKRLELKIADEDVMKAPDSGTCEYFQMANQPWKTTAEAVSAFKSARTTHLKYVKTTTEDLRNHFIQTPAGLIDCYQFIIFVGSHCDTHIRQINEILALPAFPKK